MLLFDVMQDSDKILNSGDIDQKTKLLASNNLKMTNIVQITPYGQIKNNTLKMLRILYTGHM